MRQDALLPNQVLRYRINSILPKTGGYFLPRIELEMPTKSIQIAITAFTAQRRMQKVLVSASLLDGL